LASAAGISLVSVTSVAFQCGVVLILWQQAAAQLQGNICRSKLQASPWKASPCVDCRNWVAGGGRSGILLQFQHTTMRSLINCDLL
jgi:hypothetical protein